MASPIGHPRRPRKARLRRLRGAGLLTRPILPREAWLEIDLDAIAANLAILRELAPGAACWPVVKADAYGHGSVPVARALHEAGADGLCVAAVDEALELRRGGVDGDILVLYPVPPSRLAAVGRERLSVAVTSERSAEELVAAARTLPSGASLRVHLEIETGLTRDGIRPERAAAIGAVIDHAAHLRLEGVWSHLASPENEAVTARQVDRFEGAVAALRKAGVEAPRRHLAATGGLLTGRAPAYEMTRPGLAVYGVVPAGLPIGDGARSAAAALRPTMRLVARAVRVEEVAAGTPVSYGGTWTASRPSHIATLPLGYGDGFVRAYGGRPGALVRGQRVPIVGVVAMDATMVDVSAVPGVGEGDEFVLLGSQGSEEITAGELAEARGTVAWEVLATMARRLPRVYYAAARAVRVRTLEEDPPA